MFRLRFPIFKSSFSLKTTVSRTHDDWAAWSRGDRRRFSDGLALGQSLQAARVLGGFVRSDPTARKGHREAIQRDRAAVRVSGGLFSFGVGTLRRSARK